MVHARVAWRKDLPVLTFGFLVHRDGERWEGRSVLTSHFAMGNTPDEAIANLKAVIDAALSTASEAGLTPEAWYENQVPDEVRYLQMFCTIVSQHEPERTEATLPGGTVLSLSVAREAA